MAARALSQGDNGGELGSIFFVDRLYRLDRLLRLFVLLWFICFTFNTFAFKPKFFLSSI